MNSNISPRLSTFQTLKIESYWSLCFSDYNNNTPSTRQSTIAYNGLALWQFDLYPTVHRSQGTSVSLAAGSFGSALAPKLSEVLHEQNSALPYIVMGVLGMVVPVLGLILPETKGRPRREQL